MRELVKGACESLLTEFAESLLRDLVRELVEGAC
jgi:hypothetical protein